ncbi:hypothetical protein LAQ65_18330 [Flavihumibacter profundi]|nr:Arm DNA-binding domain-containing protein [Flavihumibacter profundi]MBZ5859092.1 hypothetical protein [Flavihumibacter profundi]
MASVKIVLFQKPSKDGSLPLCLRITKDRKTSLIHLGYSIKETSSRKILVVVTPSTN